MPQLLDLAVLALATWRLANLLVNEDGPGMLLARLRQRAGVEQLVVRNAEGHALEVGYVARNSLAQGLMCVWCTSVWTAALCFLLPRLPVVGPVFTALNYILALSALAIGLHGLREYFIQEPR